MKIELHVLQNFAPSNLNRDDTGAPKDCEFGGVRRARVSSQCWKRSIREAFSAHDLFGKDTEAHLAARTKRLVDETAKILATRGRSEDDAKRITAFALQSAKLKVDEDWKTQYLLFLPRRTIAKLADLVGAHWDTLAAAAPHATEAQEPDAEGAGKKKAKPKAEKKAAKDAVPKEVTAAVSGLLADASKTPDLALFGRMIADNPDWNTDAACQVAHALSTNRVTMEFDFFTAVDDFRHKENTGSDMMGTVAFQSACFYRYACLDVDALGANLAGDSPSESSKLTFETVDAFLRAFALAIPTGKQNSMAAQNRPSYLLAVVRSNGAPQSLANAFVRPIRPKDKESLVDASASSLERYLDKSLALWGAAGLSLFACGDVEALPSARPKRLESFDAWVAGVVAAARGGAS